MVHDSGGFSLIEVLIYIMATTILSTLLYAYCARINHLMRTEHIKAQIHMKINAACDVIRYDVQKSPSNRLRWYVINPTELIWKGYDKKDYGLTYKNSQIIRLMGIYNVQEHRWIRKKKTLLLNHVHECSITTKEYKNEQGIFLKNITIDGTLCDSSGMYPLHMTTLLRNGPLSL